MTTVHDMIVPGGVNAGPLGGAGRPAPRAIAAGPGRAMARGLLVAECGVAGAVAGLATLAALLWGPGWVAESVGFLTAPALLAAQLVSAPEGPAGAIALTGGSTL